MSHTRFSSMIWPGFVDMLSALLTVILFAFMMLMTAHFYLHEVLQSKQQQEKELQQKLLTVQDSWLSEKHRQAQTEVTLQEISKEKESLRMQEGHLLGELSKKDQEQRVLLSQVKRLKASLAEREEALRLVKEELAVLTQQQLTELKRARSEFFGRLKKALEHRQDLRIAGDRFVFQSEVLFALGSVEIGEKGQRELKVFSEALKEVMKSLPQDLPWVLRIDGHTDRLPVKKGGLFSSNLELSSARALAVANFLIAQGLPADRIVAAGFGEYHPISKDKSSPQDRRIELILDQKKL